MSVTRRFALAAAVFAVALPATHAVAQAPFGSSQRAQSVDSREIAPGSTFTSTVQRVLPNGSILLDNGLIVTLAGMMPFDGGAFGGTTPPRGAQEIAGYLSPMLLRQSVRVTTLVGRDPRSNAPVPVLMYSGSEYDSLVNLVAIQRGLARYQGPSFQATPEVLNSMRQAEIDARSRNAGLWLGPETGAGKSAESPFGAATPEQQRKAIDEHNKRVDAARKKAGP